MGAVGRGRSQGPDGPLRVLESFPRPGPATNPYITQLASALEREPGVELLCFDWRTALVGRYDVVHLHWPETLVRGRTPVRRRARVALTALFCLRLWVTRTPVVRTWHNLARPPGLTRVDHALLSVLDRLTRLRIRLNDFTPAPRGTACVTILHGHYRDWFSRFPREESRPGSLVFVGRIKPYKGVEHLIDVVRRSEDPGISLVVAGLPVSDEMGRVVSELAAQDPRVTVRLEYVDDAVLVSSVTAAELVVLPYRHMHNSGTVLAALSLDRAVLVPDNEVTRALAEEVGPGWVHFYDGDLGLEDLARALAALRDSRAPARPDLGAREWAGAGRAHLAAFRRAVDG